MRRVISSIYVVFFFENNFCLEKLGKRWIFWILKSEVAKRMKNLLMYNFTFPPPIHQKSFPSLFYLEKLLCSELENIVDFLFAEVRFAAHIRLDHQMGQHHLLLRYLGHPLLYSISKQFNIFENAVIQSEKSTKICLLLSKIKSDDFKTNILKS